MISRWRRSDLQGGGGRGRNQLAKRLKNYAVHLPNVVIAESLENKAEMIDGYCISHLSALHAAVSARHEALLQIFRE